MRIQLQRLLAMLLLFTAVAPSIAQTVSFPGSPTLVEFKLPKYNLAISVPKGWVRESPTRNEILIASGKLQGVSCTCFVRMTTIAELKEITPLQFVSAMSREKFVELSGATGPKAEVHTFDTALLGGQTARRVVYTQPYKDLRLTYLSHQTSRGEDIYTVACYTEQADFQSAFNHFGMIVGSTRFLR